MVIAQCSFKCCHFFRPKKFSLMFEQRLNFKYIQAKNKSCHVKFETRRVSWQFLVLWCLSDAQTLVANNVVCTANFLVNIKKFPKSSQTVCCYVPKFRDLTATIITLLVQVFRRQKNQPLPIQRSRPSRDSQEPKTIFFFQFSRLEKLKNCQNGTLKLVHEIQNFF